MNSREHYNTLLKRIIQFNLQNELLLCIYFTCINAAHANNQVHNYQMINNFFDAFVPTKLKYRINTASCMHFGSMLLTSHISYTFVPIADISSTCALHLRYKCVIEHGLILRNHRKLLSGRTFLLCVLRCWVLQFYHLDPLSVPFHQK